MGKKGIPKKKKSTYLAEGSLHELRFFNGIRDLSKRQKKVQALRSACKLSLNETKKRTIS